MSLFLLWSSIYVVTLSFFMLLSKRHISPLTMALAEHLPECLGAIFNCHNPKPKCSNSARFDFSTLWNITNQYWEQCPGRPWLFRHAGVVGDVSDGEMSLTNQIYELIADAG